MWICAKNGIDAYMSSTTIITMEHEQKTHEPKQKKDYLLPASILIAALLIAGAVFYNAGTKNKVAGPADGQPTDQQQTGDPKNVKAISSDDHIWGSKDAPIKIIQFSDLECPFCKSFHETLTEAMQKDFAGKIAIIYRHYPLDNLHSKARTEANAAECAADQGGNDAFWKFVNKVFATTPSNNGLDLALLPKFAGEIGLDVAKFQKCVSDNKFADKIQAQLEDGNASGVRGTPYSVIITPNGSYLPLSGYMPYPDFKKAMEQLLKEK